jgi:uncharacterized repeat protein (TIGR01451 family)
MKHLFLALCLGLAALTGAQAACTSGACVHAGPRLLSVDSSRGALLNALMGGLLGSSVNLSVADWNTLAQGNLNLAAFLGALQAQTGAGSPAAALAASASLAQITSAAASAAQADGNTALAQALTQTAGQVGSIGGTVRVGDLLQVSLPDGMLAGGQVNALELVTGSVQLFNYRNLATTPTPVSLSGSALGLSSVINSVDLYAQVIEPPAYVCGPAGSTFHTAAIRVKLNLNLVALSPDVSALTTIPGISGASATISQLQLYVEVARADGIIQAVDAIANAVTVQATPGVADLYLGQIADSVFFNRGRPIDAATDLAYATIGTLTVSQPLVATTTVDIQAKSWARGQAPFASTLSFSGPWPQTRTASTSAGFAATLVNDLVANLQLQLAPSLGGTLDAAVLPLLKTAVAGSLTPVLSTLLTGLVDPLLANLGIRLGEVDVTVLSAALACGVAGNAYNDANHNALRDGVETGCGQALYAKLVPAAFPAGPAIAAAAVDPASGAYAFAAASAGSYLIVLDTNATLADVTPGLPVGWLGTEAAAGTRTVTVVNADLGGQNFGLYHGSRVAGTVFKDTGSGGGIANNALQEAAETGIAGVAVKATDTAGATVFDVTTSGAAGAYVLWLPAGAAGSVRVVESNPAGALSVGGSAGNTGGSYDRLQDAVSFANAAGTAYAGVNFADVPENSFAGDNQQTAQPGAVVFHPHAFVAGSAGRLTLSLSGSASPAASGGWSGVLYLDANCNGTADPGEAVIAGPVDLTADQRLCLVVKTFAPANAPVNAQYAQTLTASFTWANAGFSASQSRSDLTVAGRAGEAGLKLSKSVDKAAAQPGETVTYTIRYDNLSAGALANLKIHDATPAYTVFAAAQCGATPAGATCQVSQQPAIGVAGGLEWGFTGILEAGAGGTVAFSVTVR